MLLRRSRVVIGKRWQQGDWTSRFQGGRRVFKNDKLRESYGESWLDDNSAVAFYYKLNADGTPNGNSVYKEGIPFSANEVGEWELIAGGFRHRPTGQVWNRHFDQQGEPFYEQLDTNRKEWNPQPAPPVSAPASSPLNFGTQNYANTERSTPTTATPTSRPIREEQTPTTKIGIHRAKMVNQAPAEWRGREGLAVRRSLSLEMQGLIDQQRSLSPTDMRNGRIRREMTSIRTKLNEIGKGSRLTTKDGGNAILVSATQQPAPISEMESWEIGDRVYLIDDIVKIQSSINKHGGSHNTMVLVEKLRGYSFTLETWIPKKRDNFDCIMLRVKTSIRPASRPDVKTGSLPPATVRLTLPSDCLTDDEQLSTRRSMYPY